MTAVPLAQAVPELTADLAEGQHVLGAVAFLIVEDTATGAQQVQVSLSNVSGLLARGLVEVGREILVDDLDCDHSE